MSIQIQIQNWHLIIAWAILFGMLAWFAWAFWKDNHDGDAE